MYHGVVDSLVLLEAEHLRLLVTCYGEYRVVALALLVMLRIVLRN